MATFAVTPEQGEQIVQHLNDLINEFYRCMDKWWPARSFPPGPARVMPDREKIECEVEIIQLKRLSHQVKEQIEQGHVEKQLLIELNEKLGKIQENYGNILVFSATVAAIISGLKDLIDLFLGQ